MRKSSVGGRPSLGPLRVRSDDNVKTSNGEKLSIGSRSSCGGNRPSIGGRPSGIRPVSRYGGYPVGQKRRQSSGIGIRGRTDIPKDPRPIFDKATQHKMISQLLEFLTDGDYRHPISQKVLMSPPGKEFFRIFEFVYGHLHPRFKITGKPEEEIPKILKVLGYPFTISKSSMFSVGSPHTWPFLLAALIWLVELIKVGHFMSDSTGIDRLLFPAEENDFDSVPENKLLFEYCEQTYTAFLSEKDEFDEHNEELSRLLKNKYQGSGGGIEALQAENLRLKQDLDFLEQEGDQLVTSQEKREVLRSDKSRYDHYLSEMSTYKDNLQVQVKELEEDYSNLEVEQRSVLQKNKHMQAIYETQNLTPADVDRIKLNRQELQRQIDKLEKDAEQVDCDNWTKEINMTKSRELLESKVSDYNKLAHSLELIPVTAENACGVDYELKTSYQATMTVDYDSLIRPALMQLKKQRNDSVNEQSTQLLRQQDAMEQLAELVSEQQESVRLMEKNLSTADDEFNRDKENFQREIESVQEELEGKQQDVEKNARTSQMTTQDAQKQYKDALAHLDRQKAKLKVDEAAGMDFMRCVMQEVIAHKSVISDSLKASVEEYQVKLQKAKEETARITGKYI